MLLNFVVSNGHRLSNNLRLRGKISSPCTQICAVKSGQTCELHLKLLFVLMNEVDLSI